MKMVIAGCFFLVLLLHAKSDISEEELSVATYLIDALRRSPEAIDHEVASLDGYRLISFPTYDSLFEISIPSNHMGCGWTGQMKRDAFETFIRSIPQMSRDGRCPDVGSLGDAALGFCYECNASNSLSLAIAVLSDPGNSCVDAAIDLFGKCSVPSVGLSTFVGQCVTNVEMSVVDSDYLASGYISKLRTARDSLECVVLTNGISVALRFPMRCQASRQLDMLLSEVYPAYRVSSNRLARAQAVIMYLETDKPFGADVVQQYFTPVTNQLLNAAQPLPEVEALRGL